jgi:hypothetical protein
MSLHVRGFDQSTLEAYFRKLSNQGVSIENTVREDVVAACGRQVYLLDAFAFRVWNWVSTGRLLDQSVVRSLLGGELRGYFDQIVEVLRDGPNLLAAV